MIESRSESNDVRPENPAAVILEFVIALRRALRSELIRPGDKSSRAHKDFRAKVAERKRAVARRRIDDLVLEFQIRKTNRMGEGPGIEVDTQNMISGDVLVVIHRITETEGRAEQ